MSKVMGHLFLPPPWKSTFPPPVRLPPPLLLLGFFYMRTVQVLLTSRKNVIAHEKKKNTRKKKIKTTIWDPQFVSCHFSYDFFPPPWDDWKQICLNWQETDVCFRICQRQQMCVDFKNFRWKNKNKVGTGKRRCVSFVKREVKRTKTF